MIRGLMTDDEWAYFEPFLIHRGGGRPPRNHRRVLDAVFWLMRTGAPWRDLRNRIERFFNRAKNSRRVATRYDKLIESFAAFVLLACIRIWIKFVHTT